MCPRLFPMGKHAASDDFSCVIYLLLKFVLLISLIVLGCILFDSCFTRKTLWNEWAASERATWTLSGKKRNKERRLPREWDGTRITVGSVTESKDRHGCLTEIAITTCLFCPPQLHISRWCHALGKSFKTYCGIIAYYIWEFFLLSHCKTIIWHLQKVLWQLI